MSRYYDSFWFRNCVLLVALAAGGLTTFIVPSYEDMAALHQPESKTAAARENPHHTGVEVDHRRLERFRSAS
jgi:hypothetical protein